MKVAMFVYNNFTRDSRVLREATTLVEAGHEVTVVAVLDRTTTPDELVEGIEVHRIDRRPLHYRLLWATRSARRRVRRVARLARRVERRVRRRDPEPAPPGRPVAAAGSIGRASRGALMRFHKPLMFTDYYWRSYKWTRARGFDAFHAHDLHTLPVGWAAARGRGRLVYDAHELYPEISTLTARERRVWRFIEQRLVGRADAVVTVCDSIADEIAQRYGVPRPGVLLNCPSLTLQPEGDAVVRLRDHAGLAGRDEPIVLYTGGFAPHRGLPALVRAMEHVRRGVLVLMGWGSLEAELRALVDAESLGGRVVFAPPVAPQEVLAFAAGADVGVIPYEPVGLNNLYSTPNKLFDYIAVGLPVAASRLPEISRIIERYAIGGTFEPGSSEEIATVIDAILGDDDHRARLRSNVRRAAGELTRERQAPTLLDLYLH
jgi:glycosyltransferase involved in cell wall biosynthesis